MKISLIPAVTYVNDDELKGKTAVVIDVLRATSVMTTAIINGASEIIALTEVEDALRMKDAKCILGGERKGLKIKGFDLSNSPLEYTRERVEGKRVVMTTTNGTKTLNKVEAADKIYIACMLNGKAVGKRLVEEEKDTVIVCAGTNGKFSIDDYACAGKIIYEANKFGKVELDDFAYAAFSAYNDHKDDIISLVKNAYHYKYLLSLGLGEDLKYCFKEDISDLVPEYKSGRIK
jgi:2-phosphosulfolactate phosphatase